MALIDRNSVASDIVSGVLDWPLWFRFGWYDVVARYRRSLVGPLWLVATSVIFIVALGAVYSILFNLPIRDYMPFVATGTVVWAYISAVATEGLQTFVESEVYIRQMRRSLIVYACRVVWRNVIIFLNQLIVALIVVIVFDKFSIAHTPLVLLGIALIVAQAFWLSVFLGILGTRFRDLMPIVQNLLQIAFFLTPVLWPVSALGSRTWIAEVNPLYHVIQIVRLPMLGQVPAASSYVAVAMLTAFGFGLAFYFYSGFSRRIVYWL